MALPRQAAQPALPGATSALCEPEPEPSPGPEALRILPEISRPRGNHGMRCSDAPDRAAAPSLQPTGSSGSCPRARAVPGAFGDGGMAGACSPCEGWGSLLGRLLLRAAFAETPPAGGAEEAGPKPCTDGALHHPGAMAGTRGAPGMVGPSTGHASDVLPSVEKRQSRSCTHFRREWGGQEGVGAYTAFPECPGVSPKSPIRGFSGTQSKPCEHPKPVPWLVPGWGAPSARGFPKSPVLSNVTPFFSLFLLSCRRK